MQDWNGCERPGDTSRLGERRDSQRANLQNKPRVRGSRTVHGSVRTDRRTALDRHVWFADVTFPLHRDLISMRFHHLFTSVPALEHTTFTTGFSNHFIVRCRCATISYLHTYLRSGSRVSPTSLLSRDCQLRFDDSHPHEVSNLEIVLVGPRPCSARPPCAPYLAYPPHCSLPPPLLPISTSHTHLPSTATAKIHKKKDPRQPRGSTGDILERAPTAAQFTT